MGVRKFATLSFLTLILSFLMAEIGWTQEGASKIGYVNLSLVFDSYHKTKAFDKSLEGEAEGKRKDRENLVNDIKKIRDELELLNPEKRAEHQEAVDDKVSELQAFDKDSRQDLRRKRDKMIREILKEIDGVIRAHGAAEGYDYIFNDRILVYKDEANDISQAIITQLNEGQ